MVNTEAALLEKSYGAPGRISFAAGPADAPLITMSAGHSSCAVSLYGGHLIAYQVENCAPVLWLSQSAKRVRPGKAIRGGIPICWPWFGPHPADPALPAHGFARNRRWRMVGSSWNSHKTTVELGLSHDPETMALWPYKFKLSLEITLGDALTVALTTTNRDKTPFTLSQALHSYLAVSDIDAIKVKGLEQARYRDAAPGGVDGRQHGAITVTAEFDRVYHQTGNEQILSDAGFKRQVVLAKRGSGSTIVWNPWIEKARRLADMDDEAYRHFICIETANADEDRVTLEPHESHTIAVTMEVDAQ